MHRGSAAAIFILSLVVLASAPDRAQAVWTDAGSAQALCATFTGPVRLAVTVPGAGVLTVYDDRLERYRTALLEQASTIEDRRGDVLRPSSIRTGDRVAVYAPSKYFGPHCATTVLPRVRFAQDLSC
jgi:hypothetical protein